MLHMNVHRMMYMHVWQTISLQKRIVVFGTGFSDNCMLFGENTQHLNSENNVIVGLIVKISWEVPYSRWS